VGAVVQLQTAIDADAAAIEAGLAALPDVVEVLDLAGSVDYEVRLRCVDQARLHDVVQQVRALPGITASQTRPVLREVLRR
jgi:Lrp/AsnC family leucine-responsive transcriptional regulator